MIEYVVGLLFSEDKNHVLLLRKSHPDWQKGRLNGPGGRVERPTGSVRQELPLDAMRREFREETRAEVRDWDLVVTLEGRMGQPVDDYAVQFFRAFGDPFAVHRVWQADAGLFDEPLLVVSTSLLSTRTDLVPNLQWIIPLALDPQLNTSAVAIQFPVVVRESCPNRLAAAYRV